MIANSPIKADPILAGAVLIFDITGSVRKTTSDIRYRSDLLQSRHFAPGPTAAIPLTRAELPKNFAIALAWQTNC